MKQLLFRTNFGNSCNLSGGSRSFWYSSLPTHTSRSVNHNIKDFFQENHDHRNLSWVHFTSGFQLFREPQQRTNPVPLGCGFFRALCSVTVGTQLSLDFTSLGGFGVFSSHSSPSGWRWAQTGESRMSAERATCGARPFRPLKRQKPKERTNAHGFHDEDGAVPTEPTKKTAPAMPCVPFGSPPKRSVRSKARNPVRSVRNAPFVAMPEMLLVAFWQHGMGKGTSSSKRLASTIARVVRIKPNLEVFQSARL